MEDLWFIVLLSKWMMYATAISTYALRFLIPNPTRYKEIFVVTEAPRAYLVGFNILRWISGNASWIVGGEMARSTVTETVKTEETATQPASTTTTTATVEKTSAREERSSEPEKPKENP